MKNLAFGPAVFALAVFFAVSFYWIDSDKKIPREKFQKYSIYNTSAEGVSQAYNYLKETSTSPVSIMTRPLERSIIKTDSVIFRINPNSSVPPGLKKPQRNGG